MNILLSADDRTGALEIGGLIGSQQHPVPVGPQARDRNCCIVDISSRHLEVDAAKRRMQALLNLQATHRAHKMDAGLRGNWPHEVQVLLDNGYKVAVLCSFPDANRRCRDGVVYIHDVPVLESVFGQDPLNRPVSSRPAEVLEHFGIVGNVEVWDADNNEELFQGIQRAAVEQRVVVGAAGAIAAFAQSVRATTATQEFTLKTPLLLVCGSLNPRSREQLAQLPQSIQLLGGKLELTGDFNVWTTPSPKGSIDAATAASVAAQLAAATEAVWQQLNTLVVVGGDTVAAIVGDDTLNCVGSVAPGIPVSQYRGLHLITKGGGIGPVDVFVDILSRPG